MASETTETCGLCENPFQKRTKGYKRINANSFGSLERFKLSLNTCSYICTDCAIPLKNLLKAEKDVADCTNRLTSRVSKRGWSPSSTPPQRPKKFRLKSPKAKNPTRIKELAATSILRSRYLTAFRKLATCRNAKAAMCKIIKETAKEEIKKIRGGVLSKNMSLQNLNDFEWTDVLKELETSCPVLYNAVEGSIFKKNEENPKKTAGMGTILAIVLHLRHHKRFNFFQCLNSIVMWLCGSSTSLFESFNHMGICTSRTKARLLVDQIADNFDAVIKEWKIKMEEDVKRSRYRPPVCRSLFPDETVAARDHPGFSICWDNVQYQSERRHQGSEKSNKMMMWAMCFAAENRIGFHHIRSTTQVNAMDVPLEALLPSHTDNCRLLSRMSVLIGRILVEYFPHFEEHYIDIPVKHIPHKFSKESPKKSNIVNLGVIAEDPSTITGVIRILEQLQQYVPKDASGKYVKIICHGDGLSVERHRDAQRARAGSANDEGKLQGLIPTPQEFHKRALMLQDTMNLVGKGGMSSRGTLMHVKNLFNHRNATPNDVMKSFNHCVDLLEFITSGMICLLAMRILGMSTIRDVPVDSPFNGSETERREYLNHLVQTIMGEIVPHLPTANNIIDSTDFDDNYPYCSCKTVKEDEMVLCSNKYCPHGTWFHISCIQEQEPPIDEEDDWYCSQGCKDSQMSLFCTCKRSIHARMIRCKRDGCLFGKWFHLPCKGLKDVPSGDWYCCHECQQETELDDEQDHTDYKFHYSRAVIFRGLYDLVHRDVLRENDGEAMISLWKIHMIDFYCNGHTKYLINGHMLLTGINGFYPERIQKELTWNRTVNLNGGKGNNIAMDLANEFLNRDFKENIKQCHGSYTDADIHRRSIMVGALGKKVNKAYERNVSTTSVIHRSGSQANYKEDIIKFTEEYEKDKLCHIIPGRFHRGFENFVFTIQVQNPSNLLKKLKKYSSKMDLQRRIQNTV